MIRLRLLWVGLPEHVSNVHTYSIGKDHQQHKIGFLGEIEPACCWVIFTNLIDLGSIAL